MIRIRVELRCKVLLWRGFEETGDIIKVTLLEILR